MSVKLTLLGLATLVLVLLATAGTASAQSAPPDSEFDQYVPDIPGSEGDHPLGDVKNEAGEAGHGGGGDTSGGLPQGVAEELRSHGPEGQIVAGLAEATAPKDEGRGGEEGNGGLAPAVAVGDAGDSPLGTVLDALTGAGPGGLGIALPLMLLSALAGGVWYALRRRRAAGDGSSGPPAG
jgi:hypothetical protein